MRPVSIVLAPILDVADVADAAAPLIDIMGIGMCLLSVRANRAKMVHGALLLVVRVLIMGSARACRLHVGPVAHQEGLPWIFLARVLDGADGVAQGMHTTFNEDNVRGPVPMLRLSPVFVWLAMILRPSVSPHSYSQLVPLHICPSSLAISFR
jgi:hypothetical protein